MTVVFAHMHVSLVCSVFSVLSNAAIRCEFVNEKYKVDGNALSSAYDDAGRLTHVSGSVLSGRSETFALDAGNNRTSDGKTGSTRLAMKAASTCMALKLMFKRAFL